MTSHKEIIGKHVRLRTVLESDAEFIIKLRSISKLNNYIHKISDDIELQKQWIKNQPNEDYYFIIESVKENIPVGTIGIYNFDHPNQSTEWGRWISTGNSLENFEAVYLIYDFIFNALNYNRAYGMADVRNKKVVKFHKKFGCDIVGNIIELEEFKLQEHVIFKNTFEQKLSFYQSIINLA